MSIRVVDSPMDETLPPGARGRRPNAQGYAVGGTVWLFANNLHDVSHAQRVLAHEVVGHVRVDRLVGDGDWRAITESVRAIAAGEESASRVVRWAVDQAQRRYPGAPPEEFAREAVAILAEVGATSAWWERLVSGVRRTLRSFWPDLRWSDSELRDLVARAARPRGAEREPGADIAQIDPRQAAGPVANRLEALAAEEAALADRVDAAFARGNYAAAEAMDERLAVVRAEVDALAAGIEESELDADGEVGLEEELAEAYLASLPLAGAGGRTLADLACFEPAARIKGILQEHGLPEAAGLSTEALLDVAANVWRARSALQARREVPLHRYAVDAWHGAVREWEGGSPSLNYALTGEGCMAYGHGVYFASRREVAEFYRDQGSRAPLLFGERRVTGTTIGHVVAERLGATHRSAAVHVAALITTGYHIDDVARLSEEREDRDRIRDVLAELEWIPPGRRGTALVRVTGRRWSELSTDESLGLSWLEAEARRLARHGSTDPVGDAAHEAAARLQSAQQYRSEWVESLEASQTRPPPESSQEADEREGFQRIARDRIRDTDYFIREYRAAVAIAPEARYVPAAEEGLLYAVTLTPDDDAWLDWDQPLQAQSARVAVALSELVASGQIPALACARLREPAPTGEDVYQSIAAALGAAYASRLLRDAGIAGIRYLDGISRRCDAEAVTNFVVFDPADVAVRDTYIGSEARQRKREGATLAAGY
jgi:hypothetical protein